MHQSSLHINDLIFKLIVIVLNFIVHALNFPNAKRGHLFDANVEKGQLRLTTSFACNKIYLTNSSV